MSNRIKEEERIERIIRGLLKLQENRRCINCNSLGPQYVCTAFWTFVCTNCSGAHREFMHRVKSVSMAKFNAEELNALQAGGNERARQIYFKSWDPQRHSLPDGSNLHRLREFIKHVYVDRKYTGERCVDQQLPMVNLGSKEDFIGRCSIERCSPGGRKDDRNMKILIDGRRSPHYKQEHARSGGHRSRPVNFEIVDDRFRDDNSGGGRRSERRGLSNAESRMGSRSPNFQKSREITSPPVACPSRDIQGKDVQTPSQCPEANGRNTDCSTSAQKPAASSSLDSADAKLAEHKISTSGSLIDFNPDPESCDTAAAAAQIEQTAPHIVGDNLALVPSSVKDNASATPKKNSLELLLFELSAPAVERVGIMSPAPDSSNAQPATPVTLSNSGGDTLTVSTTNIQVAPSSGDAPAVSPLSLAPTMSRNGGDSMVKVTAGQQFPTMEPYQPLAFPSVDNSSTSQSTTPLVGAVDKQQWNLSLATNAQGLPNASTDQSSNTSSRVEPQDIKMMEAKLGRKELPVDLFTASYSSFPPPVPNCQIRPPHGMGFGMQYHPTAMSGAAFPNPSKSKNPFDLNDDETQVQAPMFPNMSSLQGALPMASASTGLLHSSGFGIQSSQLMQPQSLPFSTSVSPKSQYGAFMGQLLPNNMPPPRPHGVGSFGSGEDAFGSLNPIWQPNGKYSAPIAPNSFPSRGGNPFG